MSAQRERVLDYSWLHDDTEEDFVGADWHQDAIRALSTSLKTLAEERRWPWHVGDQLTLVGEKPDGKEWRPGPDISIHPHLGPDKRQEIDVRVEGPPALVLEVASASTWTYDVSLESTRRGKRQVGKAFGYLVLMRVPEYLVFDPKGEFLAGHVQAWRRVGDVIRQWEPDADGIYHSRVLDIAFRPDEALLRVFDPEGNPVPYWFENARTARALAQEMAELRAELERLRRQRPPAPH
jgi:Uma2 family endonuclease